MEQIDHKHGVASRGFFASRANIVLLGFLAIAGYFLDRALDVVRFLPWALVLACPLMHVFMHGGHGGHGRSDERGAGPPTGGQSPPHHD
jgi:hypothetical protein